MRIPKEFMMMPIGVTSVSKSIALTSTATVSGQAFRTALSGTVAEDFLSIAGKTTPMSNSRQAEFKNGSEIAYHFVSPGFLRGHQMVIVVATRSQQYVQGSSSWVKSCR